MPCDKKNRFDPLFRWIANNKFYSTTPISGFTLIGNSKFKWELLSWYTILILFGILTVVNVRTVITEYMESKTITVVSVKDVNNSAEHKFKLDDFFRLHLHLQLPSVFFFTGSLLEYHELNDDMARHEAYVENLYFYSLYFWEWPFIENSTRKEIAEMQSESILEQDWSGEFIFLFLMLHMKNDMIRGAQVANAPLNRSDKITVRHPISPVQEFYYGYLTKGAFGSKLFSLEADFERLLKLQNLTADSRIYTKFTSEMIKFIFSSDYNVECTSFSMSSSYTEREDNWEKIQSRQDMIIVDFILIGVGDAKMWEFVIHNRGINLSDKIREFIEMKITDANGQIIAETKYKQHFDITLVARSFWHTEFCDVGPKEIDCEYDCNAETIKDSLGCIPPFQDYFINGARIWCSYDQMKDANVTKLNNWQLEECKHSCSQRKECNKTVYTADKSISEALKPDHVCSVRFFMSEMSTVVFYAEELKQSFTSFLAEVGGAMDLWIGASVIGFIHLFIYLLRQFIYIWTRNTRSGTQLRDMFNLVPRPTRIETDPVEDIAQQLRDFMQKVETDSDKLRRAMEENEGENTKMKTEQEEKNEKLNEEIVQLRREIEKLKLSSIGISTEPDDVKQMRKRAYSL